MIDLIERRLSELIPDKKEPLFQAARYSLLSPGKRIRPLLLLASSQLFGGAPSSSLDPACAIEMIHCYSLIHDDLPCMDNDSLRRGIPTVHTVYGEAIALLAGNYLLTAAFDVLANAPFLDDRIKLEMIRSAALRAGASGMIGGQAIDIESEGKEIGEKRLLEMHYGKTGALFTAALEWGSLSANASSPPLLAAIGKELGLLYQFQDDLLDATSTTIVLGKTAGSDSAKKKSTAVSIYGLDQIGEKIKIMEDSLYEKLTLLPQQGLPIALLIRQLLQKRSD